MHKILAQVITLPDGSKVTGGLSMGGNVTLGDIVGKATTFIFAFAGIGLLIMLIMAGFTYMTSAGDSKKLEQGKQQLTYAILGFLIVFGAFGVVQILSTIFGIKAFEIFK